MPGAVMRNELNVKKFQNSKFLYGLDVAVVGMLKTFNLIFTRAYNMLDQIYPKLFPSSSFPIHPQTFL